MAAEDQLRILAVTPRSPTPDVPVTGGLEAPQTGAAHAAGPFAVALSGWVAGRERPVEAVECVQESNQRVFRAPVDTAVPAGAAHEGFAWRGSFQGRVNCALMPAEFEFTVRAVLEGGGHVDLATVRGRRPAIRSAHTPALRPLLITTIGRSGSTALVRLLDAHPGVVAYAQHEPRVVAYWLEVFRELSDPASYLRQLAPDPDMPLTRGWWLGQRPPYRLPEVEPAMEQWLGREAVDALATTVHARMEAVYGALATSRERGEARYFAEKALPAPYPSLVWELDPGTREVFLVRDFRDSACSWRSWRRPARARDAGARAADGSGTAEREAITTTADIVAVLARAWEARKDRAHLIHYEDLVRSPRAAIGGLMSYLELEPTPADLDAMVAVVQAEPGRAGQATTTGVEASIGRWRRELTPEEQRACQEAFGSALEAFGYST